MLDRNRFPVRVPVNSGELNHLEEVKSWLRHNVGHIDQDWDYAFNLDPGPDCRYSIYFRSPRPAMLFKLTWCGFA